MKHIKMILIVAAFTPGISLACSFDTDCNPGSKCVKASGSLEGVCVGGISPGNVNDDNFRTNNIPSNQRPATDINGTYGNTCSFNSDCGPGYVCNKSSGSIDGTCLKR